MRLEFLMEVGFIFRGGEKGKRIVGGADPKYPTKNLNWLNIIDKKIMVKNRNGEILFKVKKVDIFPSITDAINIGLTLYDDKQFDLSSIGDKVYKIIDND